MSKVTVALLFGGQSSEHEISKISALTIAKNLSKEKYTILPIYITEKGEWKIYDGAIENIVNTTEWESYATSAIISPDARNRGIIRIVGDKFRILPVDVAIPVIHGKGGEDGTIQGLLELARIPYVGCGVLSSAVCMDKVYTKIVARSTGVKQAKYKVIEKYELAIDTKRKRIYDSIEKSLSYPVFIKPSNAGSSKGITKANNRDELISGIEIAKEHDTKIIIEENINGREVECAVLGNHDASVSVVGEILPATDFYDFDAKYNNQNSKTVIPANIDDKTSETIQKNALKIFKALDCRGLSRVDFFIENETNNVIFNEINTFPGFTSISMYPMLLDYMGIKLPRLLDSLIKLAIEEFSEKNVKESQ